MRAKQRNVRRLINGAHVMAGLVPAIHVVTWLVGFRTRTISFADACYILEPAVRTPTWMAGTSPATTEAAAFLSANLLSRG
jgi:hypothetical protein